MVKIVFLRAQSLYTIAALSLLVLYGATVSKTKCMEDDEHGSTTPRYMSQGEQNGKKSLTPLHAAVSIGNLPMTLTLIGSGADVNARDPEGRTPLHLASQLGHDEIVTVLIETGKVDVNARDQHGRTALYLAVSYAKSNADWEASKVHSNKEKLECSRKIIERYRQTIEALYRAGAGLNGLGQCGKAAIHHAVSSNCKEVVDKLIELGADLNVRDAGGNTPLDLVSRVAEGALIETALREHGAKTRQELTRQFPLHQAASTGNTGLVKEIISHGVLNIETKDEHGCTALHLAALHGHSGVVKELLKHKAYTNALSEDGSTPLHYAAAQGNCKIIALLIASRAQVNAKNKKGQTPLHLAILNGHEAAVQQLLRSGADIHARDQEGQTPRDLVHKQEKKSSGMKARLGFATPQEKIRAAVQQAARECSPQDEQLLKAAKAGDGQQVKECLRKGAKINACNKNSSTALHIAAGRGHLAVVKELVNELLAAEDSVDTRDSQGCTALHIAVAKGHIEIVRELIAAGADVNALAEHDFTPLDLAIQEGKKEAAEELRKYSAVEMAKRGAFQIMVGLLYAGISTMKK